MSLGKAFSQITKTINLLDDTGKIINKSVTNIKDFGDKAVKTVTNVQKTTTGTLKQVSKSILETDKAAKKRKKKEKKKEKGGGPGAGGFKDIIGLFLEPILRPLIKIFKPFGIVFDIFAAGLQQELLPIVKRIFALLTDPIIIDAIQEIGRLVGSLFLPVLGAIENFLTTIVSNPQILEDFMSGLRDIFAFFNAIGEVLTAGAVGIITGIFQFFLDNPTIIENLLIGLQDLTEWVLAIPQWFEERGAEAFAFGESMQEDAQELGALGHEIGTALKPITEFFGSIGHAIGSFFGFAEGGIVRRPTLGMVGEAGPEAIIPLNEFAQRAEEFGVGGGGKSITIVVNGITDIPRLARKIRDEVEFL